MIAMSSILFTRQYLLITSVHNNILYISVTFIKTGMHHLQTCEYLFFENFYNRVIKCLLCCGALTWLCNKINSVLEECMRFQIVSDPS